MNEVESFFISLKSEIKLTREILLFYPTFTFAIKSAEVPKNNIVKINLSLPNANSKYCFALSK